MTKHAWHCCQLAKLLLVVFSLTGCAEQGWQKFSANTILQNNTAANTAEEVKTLEVFIFADGKQPASQTVIDI